MFGTTLPLGRIAGIRIRAHWSVVIVLAMLAWVLGSSVLPASVPGYSSLAYGLASLLFAVCFLGGLLAHELTHSFIARRFGLEVDGITLWALGGVAQLKGEPPSPKADLLVAAGGPAMSALIGGACLGASYLFDDGSTPLLLIAGLAWLGVTNLFLAGFNLLPGTPLDGGRVLRSAVWRATGNRAKAVAVAARCGQVLGVLLIAAGIAELVFWRQTTGLWLAVIGLFLISSARSELNAERARGRLVTILVRTVMDSRPTLAPGWWPIDAFLQQLGPNPRRRVFCVMSEQNQLIGLTSLAELNGLAGTGGGGLRIADVCRDAPRQVGPDEPLLQALSGISLRPGLDLLAVLDDDRLIGVVDADDLVRS
ncbi:site-2 protease family protein [Microlunatus elymi]|uniref:Zinc metalloprotease n=1 Tax=Microlunatus elymi TaxID=2596828 RepID=A0A516PU67_9ACTN|nr:site-2 protease family protein [Microlunatus elymi]QDP94670.1 site-2 protease family protein [Microlunatus elymi]